MCYNTLNKTTQFLLDEGIKSLEVKCSLNELTTSSGFVIFAHVLDSSCFAL